jgi:predicted nucleic-acid-binding protein
LYFFEGFLSVTLSLGGRVLLHTLTQRDQSLLSTQKKKQREKVKNAIEALILPLFILEVNGSMLATHHYRNEKNSFKKKNCSNQIQKYKNGFNHFLF